MPRPRKWRRVGGMPKNNLFGPPGMHGNIENAVQMTVDEFESIRLIDYEGLMQEECAERMGVARTTVQGIYSEARKKLSKCLVEGLPLLIEGGEFEICGECPNCEHRGGHCHGGHHRGHHPNEEYNGE